MAWTFVLLPILLLTFLHTTYAAPAIANDDPVEVYMEIVNVCMDKYSISEEFAEKVMSDPDDIVNHEKIGCVLGCFFEKEELLTGGNIDFDKFKKLAPSMQNYNFEADKKIAMQVKQCVDKANQQKVPNNSERDLCVKSMVFMKCAMLIDA
ncbi:uncharacterized protein [Prorops nasuta]|uniref:uncharacterized protein n=1 Tax=Prorops nasuta TaxID=863751 RepID=UPI0034CFDF22